ncbi:MAG: DUF4214 domain-containing protein [Sphingomonadaceae bacterium]
MYDTDTASVSSALRSANSPVFTDATIRQIIQLSTAGNSTVTFTTATPSATGVVTVASGTDVAYVPTSGGTLTVNQAPPVVILQGTAGANLVVGNTTDTNTGTHLVVGSAGNDNIVLQGQTNYSVVLGTGNSTVVAGAGADTVTAGLGNATVVGGTSGHTIVKLTGAEADYTVTIVDGHAVINHTGPSGAAVQGAVSGAAAVAPNVSTDVSHVQYVQLDNNKALILAANEKQAAIASLFHAALGRDATATELQQWYDKGAAATVQAAAAALAATTEFQTLHGAQTDAAFINSLYVNMFGRAPEAAGLDYWTAALHAGASRAELAMDFAVIAGQHDAGTAVHVEAIVVGAVTIVPGIV